MRRCKSEKFVLYLYYSMSLFDLTPYRNKRVCVALSGGADSVCLLHSFLSGAAQNNITVTALTCEHGIRGDRSLSDLRFVQTLCAQWNVPLFVFRCDVPAYAKEHKLGLEEAGREFRRECFERILEEGKADVVATAHHRDDYAETVLFRLARGTSLAGMKVFSERYARPLLSVGRAEIDAYLQEHRLKHVEDESNADTAYARNAIRCEILPRLEKTVAGARSNLVSFARLAARDDEYLQSLATATLTGTDEPRLSAHLPDPLFYRAVIIALKRFGIERDYTQSLLNEIASLRNLQSGKKICLPQGVMAYREGEDIVFCAERTVSDCNPFACGTVRLGDYSVTVGEGICEGGLRFDLGALPCGCELRTRREGDVFTPYGGGTKTLKKFLTDKKIPARIGRLLPLVACGNEIFAVCGWEISDKIKITETTTRQGYIVCRDEKIQTL